MIQQLVAIFIFSSARNFRVGVKNNVYQISGTQLSFYLAQNKILFDQ